MPGNVENGMDIAAEILRGIKRSKVHDTRVSALIHKKRGYLYRPLDFYLITSYMPDSFDATLFILLLT